MATTKYRRMTVWLTPSDFKKIDIIKKQWKRDGIKASEISGSAVIRYYLSGQ